MIVPEILINFSAIGGTVLNKVARRHFASDNYSGICPEALEALAMANQGHVPSYGSDSITAEVCDQLRDLFETKCDVFFVFNGTAANSLALAALCQSYHSIICSDVAHIETDECGAPEFFSNGTKILHVPGNDGKIDLKTVELTTTRRTDIHFPRPKVLSITQATEVGTVYSQAETKKVGETAKRLGLRLHMDGSRFANAVAATGATPAELTWKSGVDVLCFGGTKNGMPVGEAVVFFNPELSDEFAYRCKQAGQLASKMRFLTGPWLGMLKSGAWLKNANHANAMAALLAKELGQLNEVELMFPQQANSVFVNLPPGVAEKLKEKGWLFYSFIGVGGARLMCSWDTSESDVASLITDLKACL